MAKINFDSQSPVIAVDIILEGERGTKRGIKVALDTGATYTMIPWEIAEALGYKPEISKEKVTLITASGVETAPVIEVKKIKFLGESIDNVPVVCHDLPPKSYVTGLLGSSFLRHFKITIDYLKGILEISRE
ncbi:MAG: retropepsin-like aspartic protease [Candidatus Omnitrophota bacterium]|jgi:clan AA aspartic protease (TIGR02281 family)|nr:retropepsin-like aspartic protease [Candidatus Omnitrophota bacterium]